MENWDRTCELGRRAEGGDFSFEPMRLQFVFSCENEFLGSKSLTDEDLEKCVSRFTHTHTCVNEFQFGRSMTLEKRWFFEGGGENSFRTHTPFALSDCGDWG